MAMCWTAPPVYFDVTEDNSTEEGGVTVIEVTKSNMAQKGVIKVSKTGEVFSSVQENEGVYQPVYEVTGLPGAVFEITALEDVYTPDGTLRYSAGEVVDTITTGEDRTAQSQPSTWANSGERNRVPPRHGGHRREYHRGGACVCRPGSRNHRNFCQLLQPAPESPCDA